MICDYCGKDAPVAVLMGGGWYICSKCFRGAVIVTTDKERKPKRKRLRSPRRLHAPRP